MTIALLDSDIIAYRSAASAENEGLDVAILRTDKLVRDILDATMATSYLSFLSGENNFRKIISPSYKANRKDVVKPIYLAQCKDFLISEWNSVVTDGYEADDALGISQTEESIICSIDKDLLQVPGNHYNFVKQEFSEVDGLTGLKFFYKQALTGDTSDNIFGVKGIGPVKAGKLIDHLDNEKDMYNTVCGLYNDPDRLEINLDCLWIFRNENERWSDRFCEY